MKVRFGDYIPLARVLDDGDETKFVRAYLYDEGGNEITGSPVLLQHIANGLYINPVEIVMPSKLYIFVVYRVYFDVNCTLLATSHKSTRDVFALDIDGYEELRGVVDDTTNIVGIVEETQCP